MNDIKRSTLLAPIRVLTIFVIVGVLLFLFGPIKYSFDNRFSVVVFMSVFLLVANISYRIGINKTSKSPRKAIYIKGFNVNSFVKFCIIYTFVLEMLLLLETSIRGNIRISLDLKNIFQDAATAYTFEEYTTTISGWVISYTYFFVNCALTFGIYEWKNLEKRYHILYLCTLPLMVVYNTFCIGSLKGVIDYAVYILVGYLIRGFTHNSGSYKDLKEENHRKRRVLILGVILAIFIALSLVARQTMWTNMFMSQYSPVPGSYDSVDENHILIRYLPDSAKMGVLQLLSYLTQGYFGLSVCLAIPFKWSMGMGTSFKIMDDVLRWTGSNGEWFSKSYPVRAQEIMNYPAYSAWHTVFPWFASDFTFIGSIIIVSLIVYWLARAWKYSLEHRDIFSILVCSNLAIFFLHISGTNHLLIRRNTLVCLLIITVGYCLFRCKHSELE